jgi:hypothetical protein
MPELNIDELPKYVSRATIQSFGIDPTTISRWKLKPVSRTNLSNDELRELGETPDDRRRKYPYIYRREHVVPRIKAVMDNPHHQNAQAADAPPWFTAFHALIDAPKRSVAARNAAIQRLHDWADEHELVIGTAVYRKENYSIFPARWTEDGTYHYGYYHKDRRRGRKIATIVRHVEPPRGGWQPLPHDDWE